MIIAAAGFIAIPETLEIYKHNRVELEERFNPVFLYGVRKLEERMIKEAAVCDALEDMVCDALEDMVCDAPEDAVRGAMADVFGATIIPMGEGGIFRTLWDVAERYDCGLKVAAFDIPILQETVELCNMYGVDPYQSDSSGAYIIIMPDGRDISEDMRDDKCRGKSGGNFIKNQESCKEKRSRICKKDLFYRCMEEHGIPAVVIGNTTDSNDKLILYGERVRYLDRPES